MENIIEKLVDIIIGQLEKEKLLNLEMKPQYIYALITMIERWLTVATIIFISFLCKKTIPTILFLVFFLLLRKRTGGYHAEAFWQCYLGTITTYVAIIFICPILIANRKFLYGLVIGAAILIWIIGTINHPNIAMDYLELQESKKASRYLLGLECMVLFYAIILNISGIYICYMSVAIILCALLLCIAKLIKQEVE